tara:strand:- start:37 stop:582 length:546 start_codon:yes stop_codon:yes gene_type:complete
MSTLNAVNLKHASSSSNNIVLASNGTSYIPKHIVQVVSSTKSDTASTSSTSPTEISSDLRAAITPASTSSKILVTFCLYISQGDSSQSFRIYRDIGGGGYSVVGAADTGNDDGSFTHWAGDGGAFLDVMHFTYLDSPSTTSAVTYTPYWRVSGNTCYLNRGYDGSGNYNGVSTTTVMEIAA